MLITSTAIFAEYEATNDNDEVMLVVWVLRLRKLQIKVVMLSKADQGNVKLRGSYNM